MRHVRFDFLKLHIDIIKCLAGKTRHMSISNEVYRLLPNRLMRFFHILMLTNANLTQVSIGEEDFE